jgi:hypothetical protein
VLPQGDRGPEGYPGEPGLPGMPGLPVQLIIFHTSLFDKIHSNSCICDVSLYVICHVGNTIFF